MKTNLNTPISKPTLRRVRLAGSPCSVGISDLRHGMVIDIKFHGYDSYENIDVYEDPVGCLCIWGPDVEMTEYDRPDECAGHIPISYLEGAILSLKPNVELNRDHEN